VPDETCVTGVSAGGEFESFGEVPFFRVEPTEGGADWAVVEANGSQKPAIGQPDHVGATNAAVEFLPFPFCVGWFGDADDAGVGFAVLANQAVTGVIIKKDHGGFVGVRAVDLCLLDEGFKLLSILTLEEADSPVVIFGSIAETVCLTLVPGDSPKPIVPHSNFVALAPVFAIIGKPDQ